MKIYLVLLTAIIAGISLKTFNSLADGNFSSQFQNWKIEYQIHYKDEIQDLYRSAIFASNLNKIIEHNQKDTTYQLGLNQFSAMTEKEFGGLYFLDLGIKAKIIEEHTGSKQSKGSTGSVDWVEQGAVLPAGAQGGFCAAGYASSSVGALESLRKISTGVLSKLSVQEIIDCSNSFGNNGCNSGEVTNSFKYVNTYGISLETQYPYHGSARTCQGKFGAFKISDYSQIEGCEDLESALLLQPISVAVDATNWLLYKSGVYSNCSGRKLSFFTLLVGVTDTYWKVKMEWGTNWGEKGFMRLAKGNCCGICQIGAAPIK